MQEKWDKRYSHSQEPGDCCRILKEYSHLLPKQGCSLDLACGLGANALHLAKLGLESHGWDISPVALTRLQGFADSRGLKVTTLQRDIENQPPPGNGFDVIVVSQFLHRPLCARLVNALKPNGLLFYQTFNIQRPSNNGPNNPAYLLDCNELLSLFSELTIRAYEEEGPGSGFSGMSYLVGQKPRI
jgi:tellurite methyltransferase